METLIKLNEKNAISSSEQVNQLLLNKELSKNAKSVLFDFISNLEPISNCIFYNNTFPSISDLQEMLGFKRAYVYNTLNELEEKEVIKRIKYEDKIMIYLNPYLFKYEKYILSPVVCELFKNSKFNPDNNNSFTLIKCLSEAEVIITKHLLSLPNITIESKERLYKKFISNKDLHKKCGTMRCDWIVKFNNKDYIIEYFGMMYIPGYKEKHDLKLELIKKDNKQDCFISIYPKDLNQLDEVFSLFK